MTGRGNVLVMNLDSSRAQQILREIAEDSGRVFFTNHAEQRMLARHITRTQVLRCLKHGKLVEGPARDPHGKWLLTTEVLSAGDVVKVVAALDSDSSGNLVLVITTYL